jgi:hypothetical protein
VPPDFRERYIEMGYGGAIEEHYHCSCRTIDKWIEVAGGEELRAARYAVAGAKTGGKLRPEKRARRYVLGLRLSGKLTGP